MKLARKPKLTVVGGPGPADQSPGHNSGLTEQQEQALHFGTHVPEYERALKAKKEADSEFKNVCKRIKSENGSVDAIKLSISLRTPEGEKKFKALLETQRRIAVWNNLPIGEQGWLLDEDRRPITERAYEDGKKAGLEGKDPSPPHAGGTEANNAWMKGWHESQKILMSGIKATPASDLVKNKTAKPPAGPDEFDQGSPTGTTD